MFFILLYPKFCWKQEAKLVFSLCMMGKERYVANEKWGYGGIVATERGDILAKLQQGGIKTSFSGTPNLPVPPVAVSSLEVGFSVVFCCS